MYQDDNLYQTRPPMQSFSGLMPGANDATIAEKRWEGDQLAWELMKQLSGKAMIETPDGKMELITMDPSIRPLCNDLGVSRIISIVRSKVNPVSALSNLSQEETMSIIREFEKMLQGTLVLNMHEYGISEDELDFVYNIVKDLVRFQVKRAEGGHEAKNFRTQTLENQSVSHQSLREDSGFRLWPSKEGRVNG